MSISTDLIIKIMCKQLCIDKIDYREISVKSFREGDYICAVWYKDKLYGIEFNQYTGEFWVSTLSF